MSGQFDIRELDYELPEALIAQQPLEARAASRLLVLRRGDGSLHHRAIRDLPQAVRHALFVFNDTRVIPARLRGHKDSGGKAELLLVERLCGQGQDERWLCLGRASKGLREGTRITFGQGQLSARVGALREGLLEVDLRAVHGVSQAIEQLGAMPLPPYIRRDSEPQDRERYQTVFAAHDGAVAAPTAGLHFDQALLDRLTQQGHRLARLTLHVGPGTFAPLRLHEGAALSAHAMHAERYVLSEATASAIAQAKSDGRPVVAVGTTVVRALESCARQGELSPGEGTTSLFIYPPFEFRVVDAMLTNFHLPRSTLLSLVMAFGGVWQVRNAYQAAVEARYRFYSYGDAMLIV